METFHIDIMQGYGLTETGMATYMDPTRDPVPGTIGVANPGYEVTVVEPGTDRPLPPETPGEIVVDMKIPNIVMRAYYGMPEKTAEDFRNLKLHTGDLGRMDADGYVYFMDRVKDYIRRRAIRHLEKGRVVLFAAGTGNPFFTTDTAASLRAIEIGAELLVKATKVNGIYSADPMKDPNAVRYPRLTFDRVLDERLAVMDATAIVMCRDNQLPLQVFNLGNAGYLLRIARGEDIGTVVYNQ